MRQPAVILFLSVFVLSLFDRISAIPCVRDFSRHVEDDDEESHRGHQGSGSGSSSQTLGEDWYSGSATQTSETAPNASYITISTPATVIPSTGSSSLTSSTSTATSTFHDGDFHHGNFSSHIIGVAVGGAVGGVAGPLLITGGAVFYWRRRKRRNKRVINEGGWSVIVTDRNDTSSQRNTAYIRDEDAGPLGSPTREVISAPLPPLYNPNWQIDGPDSSGQNQPETGRARELLVGSTRVPPRRSPLEKPRVRANPDLDVTQGRV